MIRVVVGLGNPGAEYANTRHNVGYLVVEELARRWGWSFRVHKTKALVATGTRNTQSLALMKPTSYMNESGRSVRAMADFLQCPVENIFVVHDDLDSPFSRLRMRASGSAGGHNGLKSIIQHVGTEVFPRLKLGIGRPIHGDPAEFVLQPFHREEREAVNVMISQAADAVDMAMANGLTAAMNQFNA